MSNNQVYVGESWTVELNGRNYRVTIEHDDTCCAPWEDCDGMIDVIRVPHDYGRLSGPSKKPSEYVFHRGDRGCYSYVVDIPQAIEKALGEHWGISDAARSGVEMARGRKMTDREVAVYAAHQNIEFIRGWCADEWYYVGVSVSLLNDEGEPDGEHGAALWGIESISGEYIRDDVVPELIGDIERMIGAKTFPVL